VKVRNWSGSVMSSGNAIAGWVVKEATRVVTVSIVAFVAAVVLLRPMYFVSVVDATSGEELMAAPACSGDRVEVEYMHSMYAVDRRETFLISRDGRFRLAEVAFGSLAAALYYNPDPPQGLTFDGRSWIIRPAPESYRVLSYRVSPGTRHVFRLGRRTLDLSDRAAGLGVLIHIKLEEQTLVESLPASLGSGNHTATAAHRSPGTEPAR